MQFRRNGQGDERRRRVFRDEMLAATDDESTSSKATRSSCDESDGRVYSDAASAQRQATLTSLLPQRALTLVALFLFGGIVIAGIELLYARFFVNLPETYQASLAVLDLSARGNFASWFASLTLATGAMVSILVYLIRRYRLDDYRGRYRIWQWAAACFVIGSFDAATSAHAILQPVMVQLTGTPIIKSAAVWPMLIVGIALAACIIRLAIEMRGSRLAMTSLGVASSTYIAHVVVNFHPALASAELARTVSSSATLLAGHFVLLYTIALYGRFVYQEAQGTRRTGRVKPAIGKGVSTEASDTPSPRLKRTPKLKRSKKKNVRVDSAHEKSTAEPATTPIISKKSVRNTTKNSVEDESANTERPISKAERRRLRKLERRQRRQTAERDD
jgi:hypothetical protein